MRKIDQAVARAIDSRSALTVGNTKVEIGSDSAVVILHGSEIMAVREDHVTFTLAGWDTPTTRRRINEQLYRLTGRSLYREKGETKLSNYGHVFSYSTYQVPRNPRESVIALT